jgi:ketosteroid isomerase-like protein
MSEVGPYGSGISESDEYVVRVYGKVAVMTHRTTLKDPDYQFRSTHVWVKLEGRWQVVSSHYSVIKPEKR